MRARSRISAVALLAVLPFALPEPPAPDEQSVRVEPERVDVTMLYRGATVRVTAPVPEGAGVAVVVRGGVHDLTLKRKGKVLGLVWMNVGDVTFDGVPDLYLLHTSQALVELAEPTVLERSGLGFGALGTGPAMADPKLREELSRLKERDGLWDFTEGTVTLTPSPGGGTVAAADFFLPAKAPPGEYRVLVYAFEDGEPRVVGEGRVRVVQAGVSELISSLAVHHGLLYGILAVIVAAGAGLLTGVVFGLGGGKGH